MTREAAAPRARAAEPWCGALAVLLVVAAALRIAAILTVGDVPRVHGDEWQYVSAALSFARGEGYPGSFRPPVFPALLALAFRLGGESLTAARLAQVPIGLLAVALVYDLVRRRFGARAALFSALVVALNPTLVHYTHFLWSETVVATLLLWLVWSLDRFDQTARLRWLVASGAALGVASLAREMLLYMAPLVAVWLWWLGGSPRLRLRRIAIALLATAAVIAPWTIRNSLVQGRFVLISTARWAPITEGLLHDPDGERSDREVTKEFRQNLRGYVDDVEREEFARGRAMELLERSDLGWFVAKAWQGPLRLFSVDSQMNRFARYGWFPPQSAPPVRALLILEAIYFVATTTLAIVALWLVPGGRVKPFVIGTIAFFLAIHAIAFSTHRYRVPLLPLLALYVGPLVCGQASPRRWRFAGAAVCSLWLAIAVYVSLQKPTVRETLRNGPAPWNAASGATLAD